MTRLRYLSSGPRDDHSALAMEHPAESVRAYLRSLATLWRSQDSPVGLEERGKFGASWRGRQTTAPSLGLNGGLDGI